jgi:hypothetical protein
MVATPPRVSPETAPASRGEINTPITSQIHSSSRQRAAASVGRFTSTATAAHSLRPQHFVKLGLRILVERFSAIYVLRSFDFCAGIRAAAVRRDRLPIYWKVKTLEFTVSKIVRFCWVELIRRTGRFTLERTRRQ